MNPQNPRRLTVHFKSMAHGMKDEMEGVKEQPGADPSQLNVEPQRQRAKWVGEVDQFQQQMQHAQLVLRVDQLEQQMQHTRLIGRVEQLEQQMQQHQSGQRLEEQNRDLKDKLAREQQKVEALMKEKDDALRARDTAATRLDGFLKRIEHIRVGFANYKDLDRLSFDDRNRLKTRLDSFAKSILGMQTAEEWGEKIPSGFGKLLKDFSIGYNDSANNFHGRFVDMPSILSALRSSAEATGLAIIRDNRCLRCNVHQNCLLVVEALTTLQELRLWLG
ncbi:hypothetical protein BDZ91DRAFT_731015 [Kalaharituber pfeilii]|nr:hypothetical protein BDZ91DRAFT_731015 [Kalaharituber pfeilii]